MKITKLIKPVTLIVSIDLKEYTNKTYGNRYCSALVYLNSEEYKRYSMTYGGADNLISTIKQELAPLLPKRHRPDHWQYFTDWQAKGVLIVTKVYHVKERECREWGEL